MRYPKAGLYFWLLFFAINFFFFLPAYLMNAGESSFFPSTSLPPGESLGWLFPFFARNNQDIFRLSADWVLIATVLVLLRKWRFRKLLYAVGSLSFLCLFLYRAYLGFSIKTYGEAPNFSNDWALIKEVLPIFLDQFSQGNVGWIYLGIALAILLMTGIILLMISGFVRQARKLRFSKPLLLTAAGIWVVILVFSYKNTKSSYPPTFNSIQWTVAPFYQSLTDLKPRAHELLAQGAPYEAYFSFALSKKPNVYLLFVESYGEILYAREELSAPYHSLLKQTEDSLSKYGFHSQSILSESPIIGGRSWLAFTSALCGITLDNQLMYNELLQMPEYPHMVRFFNQQGYQTIRIKSMSDLDSKIKAPYKIPTRFYQFDQWLKFRDFPYHGYKYDWFGGIPDQFVLNYAREEIIRDRTKPLFLFFINMNSHGPWFPQAPVYEDWRMLDTIPRLPKEKTNYEALLEDPITERYMNAISYQLTYLTQFMKQHADSTDIFILMGDHQPALIFREGIDGFKTPLHIISRDSAFVKQFSRKGFFPGLEITDLKDTKRQIKHEDLYSLLVRAILGKNDARISW